MYEHVYPDIDELVMVRVNRVTEIGAYVSLLEFNNHEGLCSPLEAALRCPLVFFSPGA
jgi:translation initiation factor 2 subunit 1